MNQVDEELVEFDVALEAEDWMACHDLDDSGDVTRAEYTGTLERIGRYYVQAQAEGACDEGCDTDIATVTGKPRKHPTEFYPGAGYDEHRGKRWGHNEL